MYVYKHKYLEGSLTTCLTNNSNRLLPAPVTSQPLGFEQFYSTGCEFLPVDQVSYPIQKLLVTPIAFMPLLQHHECLSRLVTTVACMVHSWVRQRLLFSSDSVHCESYPVGMRVLINASLISPCYDLSTWCLQPQWLSITFSMVTRIIESIL